MINYSGNLFAVGVGDFIAYKGNQFAAMGKANIETMFEISSSKLDIRGGKRAPLLMSYTHSPNATFSIVSATYNPAIWKSSMGGKERDYALLPAEETVVMAGRTITLDKKPVAVGTIGANVWIKHEGVMYGSIPATSNTIDIPNDGAFAGIPNDSTLCVVYNYKNINASSITIPAEINPEIWHIFIDVSLAADKAGEGIVGRTVVEIPLAQLDPAQTFNATIDGYSQSKLTGTMLADKTGAGCNGAGVYAYINTEIFDQKWYDNVYRITNDIDDVEISTNGSYTIQLLALELGATYKVLDSDYFDDLSLEFSAGTATGTTFDQNTGMITAGSTTGVSTLRITCPAKANIPAYTLEINVIS